MSKTFCILPWIHAQTKPNGQIKPCCRFDHKNLEYKTTDGYKFDRFNINNNDMTFTVALNSPEWQSIRNDMLNGEQVAGCRKCDQEEDFAFNGIYKNPKRRVKSLRRKENWSRNNKNLESPEDPSIKIRYLEITMGNYCNLKCRMCSSDLSTTWAEDDIVLTKHYKDRKPIEIINIEKDWALEDFSQVEEIKFTGGEPMLHPNFIKILDLVISTGRQDLITLDIFTNASWVPREKVTSRLNQFKRVYINLSVDGIGGVSDYIRFPSDWNTVSESVHEWLRIEQEQNIDDDTGESKLQYLVKWVPCISIYNVWHFHKMVEWWLALQKEYKNKDWWNSHSIRHSYMVNILHDPAYLKPSLIPSKKLLIEKLILHKNALLEEMRRNITDEQKQHESELELNTLYNKVISSTNEDCTEKQIKTFMEYTVDLDALRGQDIRTNLPHLWKRFEGLVEYKGRINE